jgi:hypothetical protein
METISGGKHANSSRRDPDCVRDARLFMLS